MLFFKLKRNASTITSLTSPKSVASRSISFAIPQVVIPWKEGRWGSNSRNWDHAIWRASAVSDSAPQMCIPSLDVVLSHIHVCFMDDPGYFYEFWKLPKIWIPKNNLYFFKISYWACVQFCSINILCVSCEGNEAILWKYADFSWSNRELMFGSKPRTNPSERYSEETYRNYLTNIHCICVYTVFCEETEALDSLQNNTYFIIFSEICCFSLVKHTQNTWVAEQNTCSVGKFHTAYTRFMRCNHLSKIWPFFQNCSLAK